MDIRKHIIVELNQLAEGDSNYAKLQKCAELPEDADKWFQGVIESLYYKPNHHVLVLEGNEQQGNEFFRMLTPTGKLWYTESQEYEMQWISLLWNYEFFKNKLNMPNIDGFRINEPEGTQIFPSTDKRLASYCTSVKKWRYPKREKYIVHKINTIDWDLYYSIDKLQLWREIFQIFKPLGR